MRPKLCVFLVLTFSSLFFSRTGADGLNIPELFTTLNSTVYIPCYVDAGTDHESRTPISWTRVGYDGFVQTLVAPDFVSPSNVRSRKSKSNNFDSLVVSEIVESMSGTYTCFTNKGSANTVVHVLDGESPPNRCSDGFELIHGKCLYYGKEKKSWSSAHHECYIRTSNLITFKDAKDLLSFLRNLQKSGPTHYQFKMWTGYAFIDEGNSRFGALNNDAQVSPMLNRHRNVAKLSSCGYLHAVNYGIVTPSTTAECDSWKLNYLCEQPPL